MQKFYSLYLVSLIGVNLEIEGLAGTRPSRSHTIKLNGSDLAVSNVHGRFLDKEE